MAQGVVPLGGTGSPVRTLFTRHIALPCCRAAEAQETGLSNEMNHR